MKTRLVLVCIIMAGCLEGCVAKDIYPETLCIDEMGVESSVCNTTESFPEMYPSCKKIESGEECKSLKSSGVALQPYPIEKRLRIALEKKNITSTLKLWVVKGSCKVNCVGGLNDCDTDEEIIYWQNVSNALHINVSETSKYYCIRASIDDCCLVCTTTIKLQEPAQGGMVVVERVPGAALYLSLFFLFVSALAALLLAKHLCGLYFCLNRTELSSYSNLPGDGSKDVSSTAEQPIVMKAMEQTPISVLLLYSRECKNLQSTMGIFKRLLEACGLKVLDPFDPAEIENVRSGKESWVGHVLQKPGLRIILLEREIAVKRQITLYDEDWDFEFDEPYDLDSVFLYGLSLVQNDVRTCNNYNRLFVVRFDCDHIYLKNLVPLARYNLPNQWKKLVANISGKGNENTIVMTTQVLELVDALDSSITNLRTSLPIRYHLRRRK